MRIVCLCNNWVGWQAAEWLQKQGEEIVALVMHPPESAKYAAQIREVVGESCLVAQTRDLEDPGTLARIRSLNPEIGISVFFAYVLRKSFLDLFPKGCINLHPALLPYNRGAYPNVWSIVEKTPSGVTIHYIDEGLDTGDVIAQKEIPTLITDTGESLYRRLEVAILELFRETWPSITSGTCSRIAQTPENGTYHRRRDVQRIDEIDLQGDYKAGKLLDILRARTFSPYGGAYFRHEGKRIYLRLQLLDESEISSTFNASTPPRRPSDRGST
jgi:methionyl-tRNA formyltransferase